MHTEEGPLTEAGCDVVPLTVFVLALLVPQRLDARTDKTPDLNALLKSTVIEFEFRLVTGVTPAGRTHA